ncbi:MAG: ATP-binding cassette domain-containing protein, partial [Helicobacter sp.]|nr:ATP-binding cassette domain-containing protein [Helicobacter sp.]
MMLRIKNLVKNFNKIQVLRGIDFELKQGEIISVLGSSGGGKSTLLRIIAGLEEA